MGENYFSYMKVSVSLKSLLPIFVLFFFLRFLLKLQHKLAKKTASLICLFLFLVQSHAKCNNN